MTHCILKIGGTELRSIGVCLGKEDTPITITDGVTVVAGPNGSGKSTLGRIIERGRNYGCNMIFPGEREPQREDGGV